MAGRKNKTKICDKVFQEEDRISQLPEPLISEILCHLSTKDVVRTSVLSTRWRNLWRCIPDLDVDTYQFSNFYAFLRYAESVFDSHRESWIRKLRLRYWDPCLDQSFLTRWIDAATTRRVQHLDVDCHSSYYQIPLSLCTCETLVHLRLCGVTLCNSEFVSLPCPKIMYLRGNRYTNETMLQKLISGSPVLEDLTIIRSCNGRKAIRIRSHTLKRIDINETAEVVIDAPLLQCLRTKMYCTYTFQIINSGFPAKLEIELLLRCFHPIVRSPKTVICDILTVFSRVRDLVITSKTWKEFFLYSESRPVRQFRYLSHLNARFCISDLEMLPTLLESCTTLESLILEMVENQFMRCHEEKREANVMFSAVPQCLVSSLKFVELKRSIPRYDGEMELVRYFLKNSTVLEKLRLDVYYTKKAKCAFLTELVAMTRCSSTCEVLVL